MLGFEIKINDEKVMHVASDCVLCVMMHVKQDSNEYDFMEIGGMDSRLYHFSWPGKDLEVGDKIKIRVAEINEIDPVQNKYPHDRELVKKSYYKMKKELEEQGLI